MKYSWRVENDIFNNLEINLDGTTSQNFENNHDFDVGAIIGKKSPC